MMSSSSVCVVVNDCGRSGSGKWESGIQRAGLCVYICLRAQRWSKLGGPLTAFRGHLNFDHGNICQNDPESTSTSGVGLSYSPSRRVWERKGEKTEPFAVALLLQ